MPSEPRTVVARVLHGDGTLSICLDDLAGSGDEPSARADIELAGRHAAVIVTFTGWDDPAQAERLLATAADELRAIGRRRLVASVPTGAAGPIDTDARVALLEAAGFSIARRDHDGLHLSLEL